MNKQRQNLIFNYFKCWDLNSPLTKILPNKILAFQSSSRDILFSPKTIMTEGQTDRHFEL